MKPAGVLPRRPVVGLAVTMISGILLGLACGGLAVAACAWCGVAGAWLCFGRKPERARLASGMVWLLFGLSGWLTAAGDHDRRRDELRRLGACAGQRVTVTGIVAGDVVGRPLARGGACYTFALRRVAVAGSPSGPLRVRRVPVTVRWYGPADLARAPRSGEIWQFGSRRLALGGRRGRTRVNLESRAQEAVRLALPRPSDWRTAATRLRAEASRRLTLGIESWEMEPSLIQAMLLGSRSDIPPAMNRIFRDSGTIHIFAISGMNIALVAGVLIFVLGAAGVSRPMWGAALGPLLMAYTLLTGASASAMRACLMGMLYFGAPLVGRKPDGLAALAASAVILLAADPRQITDLGFLLSYVVMAGLLLLCMPFARALKRLFRVEQAATDAHAAAIAGMPEGNGPSLGGLRLKQRVLAGLADLLAVSLAAWLTAAPLTAWYFGRFTPGSMIANLLVVPTSFLVVVSGVLSLGMGVLSDWMAATFNHAAAALTASMVFVARAAAHLPGGTFQVPRPPAWAVLTWYAMLGALAWRLARRRRQMVDTPWEAQPETTETPRPPTFKTAE